MRARCPRSRQRVAHTALTILPFEPVVQVSSQTFRRTPFRDESDVIVRPQQKMKRSVRAEGFSRLPAQRQGVEVKQVGVTAFEFRGKSLRGVLRVGEDEQVKFRLAQKVEDALAAREEVGHPITGLDLEVFVALVTAQRALAVVDSDLREEREEELLEGVEVDDEVRDVRKDGRA